MLNTIDTASPDTRPVHLDVEGELQTLEGLAAALSIVRYSDDASHAAPNPEAQHALYMLIDTVVDQTGELRRAYDASLHAGATDRGKHDGEDDGEKIVCVTMVGDTAEKLKRLARHWKCSDHEAARQAVAGADREARRWLTTPAEFEAYFGCEAGDVERATEAAACEDAIAVHNIRVRLKQDHQRGRRMDAGVRDALLSQCRGLMNDIAEADQAAEAEDHASANGEAS